MTTKDSLAPGTVIDGKFRLEKVIGEGAVGVVMKAQHLLLGTPVAMKFLLPRMLSEAVVVERFAREARASASLTSEHVARILDVGATSSTGPYMVMEYLSGETVSDTIKRRGHLPVGEACSYMVQVCEALAEAHGKGIVHRDLKPANLFLATRPNNKTTVKVLDFGISKVSEAGDGAELTLASSILGTPLYMAPEQISSSRGVDGRADLWSFGVCLHRMLCGSVPFDADSLPMLAAKVLKEKPPNLSVLRPEIPRELSALVLKCLERDVNRRWQTATELMNALSKYALSSSGESPALREDPSEARTLMADEMATIRRQRTSLPAAARGRPPPEGRLPPPALPAIPADAMETNDLHRPPIVAAAPPPTGSVGVDRLNRGAPRPPAPSQTLASPQSPESPSESEFQATRAFHPQELPTQRNSAPPRPIEVVIADPPQRYGDSNRQSPTPSYGREASRRADRSDLPNDSRGRGESARERRGRWPQQDSNGAAVRQSGRRDPISHEGGPEDPANAHRRAVRGYRRDASGGDGAGGVRDVRDQMAPLLRGPALAPMHDAMIADPMLVDPMMLHGHDPMMVADPMAMHPHGALVHDHESMMHGHNPIMVADPMAMHGQESLMHVHDPMHGNPMAMHSDPMAMHGHDPMMGSMQGGHLHMMHESDPRQSHSASARSIRNAPTVLTRPQAHGDAKNIWFVVLLAVILFSGCVAIRGCPH